MLPQCFLSFFKMNLVKEIHDILTSQWASLYITWFKVSLVIFVVI